MIRRHSLGASLFATSALTAISTVAMGAATTASAQAEASEGLDRVVVTAQRREEDAQDVPISLTALPAETLSTIVAGGDDILALANRVPGLYAESSNGRVAPRFYIRGLGNTDFDLAASQPVSIIMDEIVMENVVLKSFPLFDIAQVEVLRGPQGTLFGRNTPAGIIKFDTAKPTDEYEGYINASVGTYFSSRLEGAVGGPLIEDMLSFRVSVLQQHRNDWIDNGFTGEESVMGGFDDTAARLQLLYTPGDNVELLLNGHGRKLDGTAAMFRANVFDAGSNELNDNFNRDLVFYDQGQNNPQSYSTIGGSAKLTIDFGGATLTSITGIESATGSSRGDIDGGSGAVFLPNGSFPGFIPFPAETKDSIDDLDQFTQEIRLASNGDGPLSWQLGAFYFDSDLTITTVGVDFPPTSTVRHDNQSWAIFGQATYDLTENLRVIGGVRYTEDDKDFTPVAVNFPVMPVSVSDEQVSWDASVVYGLTDGVNVYARVARGFRAPTIQARDVAFFGPPSTATSETVLSYEAGIKATLFNNRARINASGFMYDANDLQFTAIGGTANLNQLVNADGEAWGFEADAEFLLTDNFLVTGGVSYNNTEITEPGLAVAACGGGCTVLDTLNGSGDAIITGNPFPQAPEWTWNVTARYAIPVGDADEIYAFTDWSGQGDTNFFLYESAEFNTSGNIEGGLRIGYLMDDGRVDMALFARNILDAEHVKGAIDFNNLTGFVNEPRIIGGSITINF